MSQSSATLSIALEPSRRLRRFLIALHGLAALAALVNGLPVWGKIAVLSMVGYSARHCLRAADHPPVACLIVDAEQNWRIGLASGVAIEARLLPSTVAGRWLAVLHFRDAAGRFHAVPAFPDQLPGDLYRKLCVHLHRSGPFA